MIMDLAQFLAELDGGTFEQKVSHALCETALAATTHGRAGKVSITLEIKPTDNETVAMVHHTLAYTRPTKRGKGGEEDKTTTPMHVGRRGVMTFLPDTQTHLFPSEKEVDQ